MLLKKDLDKYNKNSIQHAKKFDPSLITKMAKNDRKFIMNIFMISHLLQFLIIVKI